MTGGGDPVGRAVALALAARGVRVVVAGRGEKALGETVGEIVYGGGKARHVVADARDPAQIGVAVDRANDVFGGLDIVVAAEADEAAQECALRTAAPRLRGPGASVAVGSRVSSGALAVDPSDLEPEAVAERVVALLSG